MTYRYLCPEGIELDEARAFELLAPVLGELGCAQRVLAVPPDITRAHSFAGPILGALWRFYGPRLTDVLPALGTHEAMTEPEIGRMYPGVPSSLFRVHDWRTGLSLLGELDGTEIERLSEGRLHYSWPVQVDSRLVEGGYDTIVSIGQVVPHEVVGMANHAKNIFVGLGGPDGINRSHFLGAVYGLERIMGRADTPVRELFNLAAMRFASCLPVVYILTVVSPDPTGKPLVRGIFAGTGNDCFYEAALCAATYNITFFERPLEKVVVRLDPEEYRSFWLGNKAIYRTRMAIADGGELVVIAPGVRHFGEDGSIDRLIRKYGYHGTPAILEAVERNDDLAGTLGAAAHLIHGSTEGRFTVTWCPGSVSEDEVRAAGYEWMAPAEALCRYRVDRLVPGPNTLPGGEEVYYIPNPALGLWASRDRFAAG